MTLHDDLIAARALIDTPEKWIKGVDFTPDHRCSLKAVADATNQPMGGFRWSDCENALIKALPSNLRGHAGHSVVVFNDRPSTTHADIMALFDRAINAAEPSSTQHDRHRDSAERGTAEGSGRTRRARHKRDRLAVGQGSRSLPIRHGCTCRQGAGRDHWNGRYYRLDHHRRRPSRPIQGRSQ